MEFTRRDTKVLKGVAICLMLYHHLFAFPERVMAGSFVSLYYFNDTNLSVCLGAFGRICVPMFTFLSGYGCYMASTREENMPALVQKRLWGLYKTFWMVFFVCLPGILYTHRYSRPSDIISELVYNFLGLHSIFNEEWWFVLPFALLLVLFPAIKRFFERKRASLYTDLLIIVVINAIIVYIIPVVIETKLFSVINKTMLWKHTDELLEILPAYMTGCAFARYDILSKVKKRFGGRLVWCAAALGVMLAVFFIRSLNRDYYDFINAAVFILALTVLLPLKPVRWAAGLFEKLGEESSIMWLVHTFLCYHWLQPLVYAPKYSPLVFVWLVALSCGFAKLIRLLYKLLGLAYKKLTRAGQAV